MFLTSNASWLDALFFFHHNTQTLAEYDSVGGSKTLRFSLIPS